jgi:Asp-tRNA(Asn)/Glu-tRNA(Gln) amidotransferase A subunit family amidase
VVTVPAIPDTILECSRSIAAGELKVTELVERVLVRVAETEPAIRAYAYLDAGGARTSARTADAEIERGRYRGPLHGIPVGVKDVFLTANMPTRAGSEMVYAPSAGQDAEVVRLLNEAGAIIVGKQVTHEFACGQNVPPTRNAWDIQRYPGGSTAGGGASVAVGSSLAALGTDAGGSVRKPAALNGVVGLKPTFGRISRRGIVPPSGSMDHVGIVTRSVPDAALLLQALTHRSESDVTLTDEPIPDFASGLERTLVGIRLGVADYFFRDSTSPGVAAVVASALETLQAAGAILCPLDIPELDFSATAGGVILQLEGGASHRHMLVSSARQYGAETRRYLEAGLLAPAAYLRAASAARAGICRAVGREFAAKQLDALVSPTTPMIAMLLDEMSVDRDLPRYIEYTVVANLTGLPAVSVPCGFSDHMPVGLQFIGRPFHEASLLGLAHSYERLNNWVGAKPGLAPRPDTRHV